jgi:hypothetical protein
VSPERLPLRHYRLFSRASYLEVDPEVLAIRLPGYFGGGYLWKIPLNEVAVVDASHVAQTSQDLGTGRVFTSPVYVPYLPTTSPNVNANLELLFLHPRRLPPIRVTAAWNSSVSWRVAQSPKGLWVDGLEFRMVDPAAALDVLTRAGAETVRSPIWWFTEHRETTTEPEVVAMVAASQRRSRTAAGAVVAAFPLLIAARWALDHSHSGAAYALGAVGVAGAFGVPFWLKLRNRQDKLRSKHSR